MARQRQRSSWGCVTRLGRDRYRLRWWEAADGTYERRSEVVRGTRREADRRLAEIRSGLDETERGARRVGRRLTVGQAYERWWLPKARAEVERGDKAPQTLRQAESAWRRHIAPRWASVRVDDVSPLGIQEWLSTMTKMPAQSSLGLLRRVLDLAQLYGQVQANVARNRYDLPTTQTKRPSGAYTIAQLEEIADAARGELCEPAVLLCAFGSCRTGEALGVACGDVSFSRQRGQVVAIVQICRQVRSSGALSTNLKNEWSYRPVVLPEPWSLRLMDLVSASLRAGETWLSDDGTGRPRTQYATLKSWSRLFSDGGPLHHLPDLRMRALRRSWETTARWTLGIPHERVEKMMGHVGEGVSGRHYDKPDAQQFVSTILDALESHPIWGSPAT